MIERKSGFLLNQQLWQTFSCWQNTIICASVLQNKPCVCTAFNEEGRFQYRKNNNKYRSSEGAQSVFCKFVDWTVTLVFICSTKNWLLSPTMNRLILIGFTIFGISLAEGKNMVLIALIKSVSLNSFKALYFMWMIAK